MNPMTLISAQLRQARTQLTELLARKWKTGFYLYLAAFFSLLIAVDAVFLHLASDMKQGAFDMLVRYRLLVPKPDPNIVILDINEASLAAMSKEYGRWPWPRQVMGELVEQIEKQKPQAIVFDVLFSDPDVYNADSDSYFNAAIAKTDNTFFPMLKLDPADDKLSVLKPGDIPGVTPLGDAANPDATVAMVLPFFKAAIEGGRLGTHNIYPDKDGIARQYPVFSDSDGWSIPSLPQRIAQQYGYAQPQDASVLLNWRGPPFTYQFVSFSDVFMDMGSKNRQRPADEFTGKIVIIGSTAPSLFDLKATPMARIHPGVEILATAIDNFKHNDFLRFPEARATSLLLTLAFIWATAFAFYRDIGRDKIDLLFGASQFILIGISYASINLSTLYINLTGPVTLGLAYFSIARIYSFATSKALEHNTVRAAQQQSGELLGVLMIISLEKQADVLNDAVREKIRLEVRRTGGKDKSVEILKGNQRGIWDLFENHLAISWLCSARDQASIDRIRQDVRQMEQSIGAIVQRHCASPTDDMVWFVHEGPVDGGDGARESWKMLFAHALLRWSENKGGQT